MRRKQFKSDTAANGDDVIVIDINDQSFGCRGRMPGYEILEFVENLDDDRPNLAGSALKGLLTNAIIPKDRERFVAYVKDEQNNVSMELLSEIAGYLMEQYTGNPTQQQQPSSTGSLPNGTGQVAELYARGSDSSSYQ
jgi:hypothetical protein